MRHENRALIEAREARSWTQDEEAERLRVVALELGEQVPRADGKTVGRWERGERRPGPYYTRLLCRLHGRTPQQLGLARPEAPIPADSSDLGPEDETFELARQILVSDTDDGTLETVHEAVHRLCRDYSATPPALLVPRVQAWLRRLDALLRRRLSLRQHHRLLTDAGWLHLLLCCLHNDLGARDAAWTSRDAAFAVAQEVGDGNLLAWTFETPSWFALFDSRPRETLDYAREGLRSAPAGSSGWMMLKLKLASAWARLGVRGEAEREMEQAAAVLEGLPAPDQPDHHFVFDPPKFDFYAGTAYAWLRIPERAAEHARAVIQQQQDPETYGLNPSRVAIARLDLGQALLEQGRLDEAVAEAIAAFDTFPRRDHLVRAAELDAELQARHPDAPEVRDFHERRLEAARWHSGQLPPVACRSSRSGPV